MGNLPHDVTSKEIEDLLQVYGKVTDIKLHPEINVPRGTAFLKFQNQFIADQVAKLKEIEFRGRKISVNRAVLEKPKLAGGVDVYVKDVPRDITEGEVRQIFNDCGSILKVRFPTDRLGDPLNCVFVVFENIEQARAAANKNTMLYKGRNLQIKVAIDEKKLQDENSKIYVYGFPRKDTTETHLRAHFSGFGKILRVGMLSKGDSAKGDAVITFSNSKEAYAAINQADKRLLGHLLKIDLKKPKIIS